MLDGEVGLKSWRGSCRETFRMIAPIDSEYRDVEGLSDLVSSHEKLWRHPRQQPCLIPAPHNWAVIVVQLGALNNIEMMRLGR